MGGREGKGKNIFEFLNLNRNMSVMLILVVLIGVGEKMAERFLPLYLIALGGSTYAVGFLNAMDNLLSALYSFPGGYLADRLGYKRSLMLFTALAMVGYVIVLAVPSWQSVLVGAVFFIAWTAISLPAVMSLVAHTQKKEKRTMGVSLHSLVRRVPMALGPVLGGVAIGIFGEVRGIQVAFWCALILGAVAMVVLQRYMDEPPVQKSKPTVTLSHLGTLFSPSLKSLLVSDVLIRFAEQIPYAFVILWVVERNGLSPLQFGYLTAIEMVTAMLIYIPVAYLADKSRKKPFVLMTFVFFTVFPLVLIFSRSFPAFVVAFIIRGLKEFGEPTRKALIMDLAPESLKAQTFGTYYLIRDVIVSAAALSSAWLWNIRPEVNFMVAFGFGLAGTVWFAVKGKDF